MRRYANRNRDFMGYEEPRMPMPPANQLDPKDERLIEAHLEIGRLQGANDLLAEDNGRLEDENRQLREEIKEVREKNKQYELGERAAQAGYKSGSQLVDEIESALQKKLETKE